MAVLSLAAACSLYLTAIAGAGFPDGHLTDYQRWILPYQQIAVGAFITLAVVFTGLAFAKPRAGLFTASVVAAILLAIAVLVALPAIGLHGLQLEHGQGG